MSRIEEASRRAGTAGAATSLIEASAPAYVAETVPSADGAPSAREYFEERKIADAGSSVAPWTAGKVVVSREMTGVSSEQYRRLAAELHSLQLERGIKTLMVSSAIPQEGKTLTITNLALTLSDAYDRRVLLIDADLRRPAVHEAFGVPNDRGFADVLRAGDRDLPVRHLSRNLSILTAGRLNTSAPMAELTSERFGAVIAHASTEFDWVLIDTPPAGLLPDAQLVARVADAVVFVINAGSTPYDLVRRALEALGDRVVGVVLNRVEQRRVAAADYYQGYYADRPGA